MTVAVPVLPPMLARMPHPRPACTYGDDCGAPATAETMTLWREHADDNLIRLAEAHMRPVCERHLDANREIYNSTVDGSMFIVRRLVEATR